MKAEEMINKWLIRTDFSKSMDSTYLTHIKLIGTKSEISPFLFKECIYGGKFYKFNTSFRECLGDGWGICNIEEIQQYLPEGHVDKLVKIPEKWFIRTNKDTEPIVIKYFSKLRNSEYNNDYMFGKGWGFINDNFEEIIHPESPKPEGYTEISFEFFSKNVLKSSKDMNKNQNFSISGSLTLKKAFVEEVGLPILSQNSVNTNLTAWDAGKGLQGGASIPPSNHIIFNLPEDWDNAIQYVKEYFKEEPKFKIGDYVVITNPINSCNSAGEIGVITELEDNDCRVVVDKTRKTNNWIPLHYLRLATPEEIKSVQTKTITIGDKRILFTISKGKIVADGTEFSVQDWKHIKSIMLIQSNLHQYSVIFPTVKVGCTTITLDEINLIIDTYNKLND